MDADEREADGKVDQFVRDEHTRTLDDLEAARVYFLEHARKAAQMIPASYLSKWNFRTKKDDQTAPEVIERFVEIAADGFNDLLDHEEVERSKEIVETGREP